MTPEERSDVERRTSRGRALIAALTIGLRSLVRRDIQLAKEEVASKVKKAGVGAGMFGGAGIVGLAAVGSLTAAMILALAIVLPAWASALIVAAFWGLVALILVGMGKRNISQGLPPAPTHTAEAVKDDVRWLKRQVRQAKR